MALLRRATQALFPQLLACSRQHTSSAAAVCSTSSTSGISRRGLSTDDKPKPESLTPVDKAKAEEWVEVDDAASGKTYW